MPETYSKSPMDEAFEAAELCQRAEQCRMARIGLALFSMQISQRVIAGLESGPHTPYEYPEEPCPNQNQLFCQDRLEQSG